MTHSSASLECWVRDRKAEDRERVIAEYAYLCRRAARRFVRPGLDRADLEQIATIGLIKATDRYDCAMQTPFEAYAWLLVVGELMHYVRDYERVVRAPRRVRELDRRWANGERDLWMLLGRQPSERDVVSFLNVAPSCSREVREYRASRNLASLERLSASDAGADCPGIERAVDRVALENILAPLTPLERKIVRGIHLEGLPIVELAARLGYSRRHVTRLHASVMARLRNAVR